MGMVFEALDASDSVTATRTFFSVGGGALLEDRDQSATYPFSTVEQILEHCETSGQSFWEYVEACEGKDIWPFLETIWTAMCGSLEMGLEHHLGLTCDPVAGLVQIPCIERNAHAAVRSLSCARFAFLSDGQHHISYDDVVTVMFETGHSLSSLYRETSAGGPARIYKCRLPQPTPKI